MAKKTKMKTKTPPKKKEAKSNSKQGVWGFGRGGPNVWNASENSLFKEGIKLHGWGAWNKIEAHIPTRSKIQIKSHAQKLKTNHPEKVEQLKKEHEVNEKKIKKKRGKEKQNEAVVVECEFTYCFVCIY